MTNEEFAKNNAVFRRACELAKTKPTRRQASRWRNKKGKAYALKARATREVNKAVKETS